MQHSSHTDAMRGARILIVILQLEISSKCEISVKRLRNDEDTTRIVVVVDVNVVVDEVELSHENTFFIRMK